MAPVQNLHNTTISRQNPRPAVLYVKSMGNTTGLGRGAEVVVLCRIPVTLTAHSSPSRHKPAGLGAGARRPRLTRPATCRVHNLRGQDS